MRVYSSHDEIIEIRLKIGELLREHEQINQKRHNLNQLPGSRPPSRVGTAPSGGRQRIRSAVRSRPTSPPMLEKFMQFERLNST